MLKRKMYKVLEAWHQSNTNKAFMLVGARQTGKTFIIREFAKDSFADIAEVNFLRNPNASEILASSDDVDDFIQRMSLIVQKNITSNTLIFLDEVQAAPEIITMVKFLVEDGRYSVALSGSMLGTELKGFRSFPVGYVQIERMFPLDFEEFCWSQDVPEGILDKVRDAYQNIEPLDNGLHEKLLQLYKYHLVVGGMPEVVQQYIDQKGSMMLVRDIARQIVEQYRFDISQYAKNRASAVRAVYNAVPSQLDKANKRFRMDAIKKDAYYERYADDFTWLIDAGVVLPTYCVAEPKKPLERTAQKNKFKLYECDTGLLFSQYDPSVMLDALADETTANFGAVYENAVAQELATKNSNLYYYYSSRRGEVDFLIAMNDGSLIPLEVKSGKDYRKHAALNNLLGVEGLGIEKAYVLSLSNIFVETVKEKPVTYFPLYMTFCIAEASDGNIKDIRLPKIQF